MKKQLFTLLCAAMLLTSCGQTANSNSDKSSADKTDVQTSLTDSVVSQTETDADTVTYMVRHFPYYKQNDEHSTVIEDAGECAVITENLDKIETMLTDEYKVEVPTNDAHSDLESYAINGSGSESGKWVFITVDNIDGYNFSADQTNYNIPDEYLKPILDILTQKLPAADTQAEQDDPDTSGYRVRLLYDIHNPDNSWYITDPAVMGYLDDFTQNYLSDCEEITEIGTVKAGPNFADVFFENGSELYIRSVCGNVYNINFDEKYYEIPQDKLDELMNTISSTQPTKASADKKDVQTSLADSVVPQTETDADTQAEQDDPDTSGYKVRLSQDPYNPDNSWYITDPAVMGYLDDFTQNYLSDCEEITEIGTVPGGSNFADVFFENGSEMFIRPVCGNIYNIRFDEKYYEIPQDKLDELMNTISSTQPSKASSDSSQQ